MATWLVYFCVLFGVFINSVFYFILLTYCTDHLTFQPDQIWNYVSCIYWMNTLQIPKQGKSLQVFFVFVNIPVSSCQTCISLWANRGFKWLVCVYLSCFTANQLFQNVTKTLTLFAPILETEFTDKTKQRKTTVRGKKFWRGYSSNKRTV